MTRETAFHGAVLGALAWLYRQPPSPTIDADQAALLQPYLHLRAADGIPRIAAAREVTAEVGNLLTLPVSAREQRLALLGMRALESEGKTG